MSNRAARFIGRDSLLRRWDGPLTEQLVRAPGAFGLGQVPARLDPDSAASSVCGYCSTGCSLQIHLKDGEAVNLTAQSAYPVNLGMACPKGWEALTPLGAPDRAVAPLIREQRGGPAREISWEEAASLFCGKMRDVQAKHGPQAAAFLSTGQICTEEMALLGVFAKFGMGLRHGDGNTRQCMATSATAYKQSFGFDAPPFTYADFEESDVLVFIGANPCIAHPIMWQRVLRNRRSPEILVIDPRHTETAQAATLHLPVAPKGDLTLLYAAAHVLLRDDAIDHQFVRESTSGLDEFAAFVREWTPQRAASECGIAAQDIERFAALLRPGRRVSFWWTMGVNQSHQATRTAQAIINLALLGGHIGKPGTGANSITGQCNAMGSRLFSNTTNLLGGHRFESEADRIKVAAALQIDAACIPDQPSLAYDQILEGVERGEIRALWIVGTNPAHSWIHSGRMQRLLEKLDFLVVQDMYHSTETAAHADLLLPAAGWGEKEGTFINSERRIGLTRRVKGAPGSALADFHIFRLLAEAWGCGEMFREWTSPEAVFRILQRCSAGQPCDITGIRGYSMIDQCGGVQWPLPAREDDPAGIPGQERRLFADGRFFTADGKAAFHFDPPRPMSEPPDKSWPLTLLTGRGSSAQWHTGTRTSKSAILRKLHPHALLCDIHPDDAAERNIAEGDPVRVSSRRGALPAIARVSPLVPRGVIFLPMHDRRVNILTHWEVDPHSRQPSFKGCAAQVTGFRAEGASASA